MPSRTATIPILSSKREHWQEICGSSAATCMEDRIQNFGYLTLAIWWDLLAHELQLRGYYLIEPIEGASAIIAASSFAMGLS